MSIEMLKKINLNIYKICLCLSVVVIIGALPCVYAETNSADDKRVDKELIDKVQMNGEIREALDVFYQMNLLILYRYIWLLFKMAA